MRYAVHHEYAETAVDVIARRCRLSFLNVQATLDALPRVIDIMAEERKWTSQRKAAELEDAVRFLASMGLPPGAAPTQRPHSLLEKLEGALGLPVSRRRRAAPEMMYSRAQFETGEVEQLKAAFAGAAHGIEAKLGHERVLELVKGLSGFAAVNRKDYDYVLEEAGFSKAQDLDFDEFVEVSAGRSLPWRGHGLMSLSPRSVRSFAKCCSPPSRTNQGRPRGRGSPLRRVGVVYKAYIIQPLAHIHSL